MCPRPHRLGQENGVRKARRTEDFMAEMLKTVNSAEILSKRRAGRFIKSGGTKIIIHLNKDHFMSEMVTRDKTE